MCRLPFHLHYLCCRGACETDSVTVVGIFELVWERAHVRAMNGLVGPAFNLAVKQNQVQGDAIVA